MVFYRKYRPQTIAHLDNSAVRETLHSVLSQDSFPHAFLFTGPKGLGKTSTARIVAKVINCEKSTKKNIEPCNACDQCKSITNGSNMDILEIDAASNRGIDEIRDLREKIRLAPLSAKKKVYIIDEVHMLTTEAFNALLKTLEEPPAHVVFILCTTESHKVPATILSRCFHIQFTVATEEELKSSFARIVESEKIAIDDEALSYIAHLSDGSFRDGAKILEEVALVAAGKKITRNLVEEKYNITNVTNYADELWEALLVKDTKKALQVVSTLVNTGSDIRYFIEYFTEQLHSLLLQKAGVETTTTIKSSKDFSLEDIKTIMSLLCIAYKDMKSSAIAQLPLELAIIEWGESTTQKKAELKTQNNAEIPRSSASGSAQFSDASDVKTVSSDNNDILQKLIDHLKVNKEHATAGLLRGCAIKEFDGKTLVIETKYSYHKDRLNDKKSKPAIDMAAEEVVGSKVVVRIELKE